MPSKEIRRPPRAARCLLAVVATLVLAAPAAAQLRVVNWNITHLAGDPVAIGEVLASLGADDIQGFAVAPHVLVFQEARSSNVAGLLTLLNENAPAGVAYQLATFTATSFENGSAGAQALYYRTDTLFEIGSEHVDIFTGAGRNTDRWRLQLVGTDSLDAGFYVYSSHLKAAQGSENEQTRLDGVNAIRDDADALGTGVHIIYAGDFNFYDNDEPGYEAFLAPGPGSAIDPLGSGPWNGRSNAIKHTQSPRAEASGDLIGGGLDDRFDFQLSSSAFNDGTGFARLGGSYRTVGNDGMHYNDALNANGNTYFPGEPGRSLALANALHDAADHLPLLVDYQLPAQLGVQLTPDFGRVIVGTEVTVTLEVTNPVEVVTISGVEPLQYEATAAGIVSGRVDGVVGPAPDADVHVFAVDTSEPMEALGTVLLSTPNEGASPAEIALQTTGTVLRPSNPSFAEAVDIDFFAAPWPVEPDTGVQSVPITVHNFAFDEVQSLMNIDFISGLGAPFGFGGGTLTGIGADPTTIFITFDTDGLDPGVYDGSFEFFTSDEDVPGATTSSIVLELEVTVAGEAIVGDLNGDGTVDGADLGLLLGVWGTPDPNADLNDDGVVDGADLGILLANWHGAA